MTVLRRPELVANGVRDPRTPKFKQIVVRIDDETFAAIRVRAVKERTSFSEQVRLLLEWGLEAR